MHDLFNEMMEAYNAKNMQKFEIAARMLVDNDLPNPFPDDAVEHNLFFKAKRYRMKWRAGGVDMRSSRRNMMAMMRQIAELQPENPYPAEEPKRAEPKEEVKEEPIKEEIAKQEEKEDVMYLMSCMVKAYDKGDEAEYEMYVTKLMEAAKENPFLLGTNEYEMFSTMITCYKRNPPNKRKTFVVGKQLCDLINATELYPEKVEKPKQTVLGVLPEEKKNWRKLLFPWKKEGEQDDGQGTN